ncbi:hypothetical protein [Streptomyces triticirhizae]|uniref:hypothetical protein n=1 Tax=Streptomyces triticirhizae TaxID=2483353 RepID=UPI001315678F|nr:hypothetical protein [Streptomyces triticirhizae]
MNLPARIATLTESGAPAAQRIFAAAGVERAAACALWALSTQEERSADADFYIAALEQLWSSETPPRSFVTRLSAWTDGLPEFAEEDPPGGVPGYVFEGVLLLELAAKATLAPDEPETLGQVSDALLDFANTLDQEESTDDPLTPGSFDFAQVFSGPREPQGRHCVGEKEEQLHTLSALVGAEVGAVPAEDTVLELRARARAVGRQRLEALKAAQSLRKPWEPR